MQKKNVNSVYTNIYFLDSTLFKIRTNKPKKIKLKQYELELGRYTPLQTGAYWKIIAGKNK